MHNLKFLPVEIQASVGELRALNVPESALTLLIDRILKASEAKVTSLQMDIERIERSLETRVDRGYEKLASDLRTQHGATNLMLVDIHAATQSQGAAVNALWAEFRQFGETVSDRLTGVEERMGASEADRKAIHDAITDLNTRHGQQLGKLQERLTEIERLLEDASTHEAGG